MIPTKLTPNQIGITYASEADILNMALFGFTAKEWHTHNSELEGNVRDHASIYQLIVLVNLESMNAELIKQGLTQTNRLKYLNKMAIEQMESLTKNKLVTEIQKNEK